MLFRPSGVTIQRSEIYPHCPHLSSHNSAGYSFAMTDDADTGPRTFELAVQVFVSTLEPYPAYRSTLAESGTLSGPHKTKIFPNQISSDKWNNLLPCFNYRHLIYFCRFYYCDYSVDSITVVIF